MFASSALLPGSVYRVAWLLQVVFYGLGLLALLRLKRGLLSRTANVALTFVVLNTAAVVAFANFAGGRKTEWGRRHGEAN